MSWCSTSPRQRDRLCRCSTECGLTASCRCSADCSAAGRAGAQIRRCSQVDYRRGAHLPPNSVKRFGTPAIWRPTMERAGMVDIHYLVTAGGIVTIRRRYRPWGWDNMRTAIEPEPAQRPRHRRQAPVQSEGASIGMEQASMTALDAGRTPPPTWRPSMRSCAAADLSCGTAWLAPRLT